MSRTPPTRQGLRLRENQLFFAITVLVGVLAGLSAVLFALAIQWTSRTLFGLDPSALRLFLVPTLASIVASVLLARVFPDVRGSGVPQTKAAFRLHGGVIPFRVPLGKFLMGALCVGSGHSMGREGPSVQIGAGLASSIGRWIGLPPERIRELVPVGAAGALAAAFNTPVSAVIFALEEIIGDLNAPLIGSTVIASVASVMVERSILGNEPLFRVPIYHLVHPAELLAYAGLGILGGLVSAGFCRTLLGIRRATLGLPSGRRTWLPALGGALVGLILIGEPAVMGVGYESIDQALNGGLALDALLLLGSVKIVATLTSYTTGNAGGIFAPSLFIGAMAGGAVGTVMQSAAWFPTADPGAYALVGMGALFAGIIRAPLTSVFMIFEITQDYQILVPLMVANLLSFVIARRFQPVPVYHALLEQDGVHLPRAPEPGGEWTAADVLTTEIVVVPPATPLDRIDTAVARVVFVGDGPDVAGALMRDDVAALCAQGRGGEPVGRHATPVSGVVRIGDGSLDVLRRLTAGGAPVPVLDDDAGTTVVRGAVAPADVIGHLTRRGH